MKILKTLLFIIYIIIISILTISKGYSQLPTGYYPSWNQLIPDTTVTIKWNTIDGTSSYNAQIASDISFNNLIIDSNNIQADTLFVDGLAKNQTYYWRISANGGSSSGVWGPKRKFNCFVPNSISSLALWLNADKGVTLSGQNVTEWKDQSGNNNDLFQSDLSLSPLIKLNAISNKPSISFDGSNDYMSGLPINNIETSSISLFLLTKGNTQGGLANAKSFLSIGTTSDGFWFSRHRAQGKLVFYNNGTSLISSIILSNNGFDFTILSSVKSFGKKLNIFNNSILKNTSTNSNIIGNFTNNNICVGGTPLITGSNNATEISEIILYQSDLNDEDRQTVERYLSAKYEVDYVNIGKDIINSKSFCNTTLSVDTNFVSYIWSTGETNSSIKVSNSGTYWVEVNNRFGYTSSDTVEVIIPDIKLNYNDTLLCYGDSLMLSPGSSAYQSGYTFLWANNETTETIKVNLPGQYWVKVTDTAGCYIYSDTINVLYDMFPSNMSLGADTSFCSGNFIKLIKPSSNFHNLNFLWSDNSTDSTLTINNTGNYSVSVTNNNGCIGIDTIYVNISGVAPQTDFISDTMCAGSLTHFTDLSTALAPDYVNKWLWIFGTGDSSDLQNPTYQFSSSGTYNVSLTAITAGGCLKEKTLPVLVYQLPQANFITSTISCINNPTNFFSNSTPATGDSIISYYWDFDDPLSGTLNNSILENPQHIFTNPSIYNVSLTIYTKRGCSNSVIIPINVVSSAAPVTNFTLISPLNNFITSDTVIGFNWAQSDNAIHYKLEVATDLSFTNIINTVNFIQNLNYTLNLSTYPDYFWRVTAFNACSDSIISNTHYFQLFTSSTISGMDLWFKADEGVNLENGNEVSQWFDYSGNNRHAEQTTQSLRPVYITNSINGLPVVRFGKTGASGNRTYLDFSPVPYTNGDFTFFTVYKPTAINKAIHYIITGGSSSSFLGGCHAGGTASGINGYGIYDAGTQNARNATTEPTNWGIVTHFKNKLFRNGTEATYSLFGTLNTLSLNRIGTRLDHADFFFYGDIAEIITFNKPLSTQQQESVEKYLRYKYAGPPVSLGPDISVAYGFCNITLDAGSRFTSYLWSTGETTNQITVNNGGHYWVSVTDIFGYISSDTIYINKPILNLNDTAYCAGSSINISSGLSGNYTYLWSTSETTQSININNPGNLWLKVTDTLGCNITDNFTVAVDSFAIIATLGPDTSFCSGNTISLINGANQAISYLWNDGSTGQNLTITNAGNYSLTVTNSTLCQAIDSIEVTIIGIAPFVNFISDTICFGDSTSFTNLSYPYGANYITSYNWDFGDNETSNIENPKHKYSQAGTYNVKLIAETDAGCSNLINKNVIVYPTPIANFQPNNSCNGKEIFFEDLSISPLSPINSWFWEFNDPYSQNAVTSNLQNPSHTFDSVGIYPVTLTITNINGCTSSITKDVTIRKTPVVEFTSSNSCFGEAVYFADITPTQAFEPITSWHWDFGDGYFSNIINPVHNYDSAKTYSVTLTVQSINGCYGQITKPVKVNALPVANFEPENACAGSLIHFNDLSSVDNDIISSWLWSNGQNFFSINQNPEYIFSDSGSFPITLFIQTSAGCEATSTKNVIVSSVPTANFTFTPDFGVPPLQVDFLNESEGGNFYTWNFGDGNTSNFYSPNHIYTDTGSFIISMIATNNAGCSDTAINSIYIIPFTVDIAVTKANIIENDSYLKFDADITNFGTINIREINMKVYIKGGIEFSELWSGMLAPGESMNYKFNASYKISPSVPREYICIKAELADFNIDNYPDNNENCIALIDNFYIAELYPNPVNNNFTADIILPSEDIFLIDILTSSGSETNISNTINGKKGINRVIIQTIHLSKGVYALRVRYKGKTLVKMFVKE